ncbi:MAG TPA: zf-HC2 domain-containing protein [Cellulomonas sp.]|uniref:anti-sigma factor family protein n=1 Tax=Cellulomonas sp. TaxID=40001 RepID=UPI002E380984|nr:zf-HC2 domain-containing protein [Cellulomonas sp.]HEX5333603.1 zf-HC2 domain-containing protein [Cellulomonas sp.]
MSAAVGRDAAGSTHVRLELGALVLGALDADDRARVEAHLAGCDECCAELAELAPLPGLLHRVPEADVLRSADVPTAPAEPTLDLVPAVLALAHREVRAHRATLRRRWAVVGVAATVLGGLAVGTGALLHDSPVPQAAPTPVVVHATDPTTGVQAQVTLTPSPGGTDLALRLTGVPAGEECRLVATAGDQRDVTASWDATYTGEATFTGSTHFAVDQIDMLVIETPTGQTLLTMPVD